ncbi:PGF-CTERM-anchored ABC transporter substrate-binding protein [Natronobacterium texcoconense]|uniref:Iron complex transport system substrate-binding protein n=1 Tax=Natronobacterium texcoconense TaxID=1095778 RepID=A0A1H1IV10_NATTX|nr:PGF-CTERM-anchored ABC transporter substrate-binding protein [Natronobacterium texcoconense]SDR41571.1 iron complex transport system substrate-binding protein [Natronobacterium texcoconense]
MRNVTTTLMAVLLVVSVLAPATIAGSVAADTAQPDVDCEHPMELTDATGEEVSLEEPPERVVALQPSDTQTVFEIGAEDQLVGMPINDYTDHHDAGDRTDIDIPEDERIDVETVIDLEPDVVLAANVTVDGDVQQLRDAGLTVYHFETAESLDDVRDNVYTTGQLIGECEGAEERVDWMDERLEVVEEAVDGEDRPLAYWSLGFGWTAGAETFQDEVLQTAGVENLGAEAGIVEWQEISDEVIIEEDPEWIIYGVDEEGEDPGLSEGVMATTAYENDQLVAVDSNQINQAAPHVVYAIEDIVQAVHPEAYEEAVDELEGTDSEEDETDESETDADDEEAAAVADGDADDSIPGFAVSTALVAVLLTSLVLVRSRQ